MIQIHRPGIGPPGLKESGEEQTRSDCEAYDSCPQEYDAGRPFLQKRTYYSAKDVKNLLVAVHHNKCCYCEKKFLDPLCFDVEHFRPKRGVRQSVDVKTYEPPGYYWLAYRWDNLLLSCIPCNRKYKDTCFPLRDPLGRAWSHHHDITLERPLLIDPVELDPRDHIQFFDERPVGVTDEGRATIKVLDLSRVHLTEDRRGRLDEIVKSYDLLKLADAHSEIADFKLFAAEARDNILTATHPDSEISSMVIDYVACH